MTASVTIFHNVVWSRHKGVVFSALHNISASGAIQVFDGADCGYRA